MTKEEKDWIDNASYIQLLGKWRNAPVGDAMFAGDTGDYFAKVMQERKKDIGPAGHTAASKYIGWG